MVPCECQVISSALEPCKFYLLFFCFSFTRMDRSTMNEMNIKTYQVVRFLFLFCNMGDGSVMWMGASCIWGSRSTVVCGWCLACGSQLQAYETDSLDRQTDRSYCRASCVAWPFQIIIININIIAS